MNNNEVSLPPCPECGGERVWFQLRNEGVGIFADLGKGVWKSTRKSAWLHACTCLQCGATTLRPAPDQMETIREWGRTQEPFGLFS